MLNKSWTDIQDPESFPTSEIKDEVREMEQLVQMFADVMKVKLVRKAKEGYTGGLLPKNKEEIMRRLLEHTTREPLCANQEVDVANLAFMLWAMRVMVPLRGQEE